MVARNQVAARRKQRWKPHILRVGDAEYLRRWEHVHLTGERDGTPTRDCTDVLEFRRTDSKGWLRVVFREGPHRSVPDGSPFSAPGPCLMKDPYPSGWEWVSLHEPGTQLAVLDEALKAGWDPADPEDTKMDGWDLFDAVYARRKHKRPEYVRTGLGLIWPIDI